MATLWVVAAAAAYYLSTSVNIICQHLSTYHDNMRFTRTDYSNTSAAAAAAYYLSTSINIICQHLSTSSVNICQHIMSRAAAAWKKWKNMLTDVDRLC